MAGSVRTIVISLAVCGLFPLAACSRTSDGTVVMKKPPPVSTLVPSWMRVRPRYAEPVNQTAVAFPPPPISEVQPKKQRRGNPIRLKADANLACFDRRASGKRIRVLCK